MFVRYCPDSIPLSHRWIAISRPLPRDGVNQCRRDCVFAVPDGHGQVDLVITVAPGSLVASERDNPGVDESIDVV